VEAPPPKLWDALKQAIRGSEHHDYTEGAISRAILLLAVPMILEMAMESVFAVVDVYFAEQHPRPCRHRFACDRRRARGDGDRTLRVGVGFCNLSARIPRLLWESPRTAGCALRRYGRLAG